MKIASEVLNGGAVTLTVTFSGLEERLRRVMGSVVLTPASTNITRGRVRVAGQGAPVQARPMSTDPRLWGGAVSIAYASSLFETLPAGGERAT